MTRLWSSHMISWCDDSGSNLQAVSFSSFFFFKIVSTFAILLAHDKALDLDLDSVFEVWKLTRLLLSCSSHLPLSPDVSWVWRRTLARAAVSCAQLCRDASRKERNPINARDSVQLVEWNFSYRAIFLSLGKGLYEDVVSRYHSVVSK